jgi:hypothetical protein
MERKSSDDLFGPPPPPASKAAASSSAAAYLLAAMQDAGLTPDMMMAAAAGAQKPKREVFVPHSRSDIERNRDDRMYLYNPDDKMRVQDNPRAMKKHHLMSKQAYLTQEEAIARYNRDGFNHEKATGQQPKNQAPRPRGIQEEFGAEPGGKMQDMPDLTKITCAQCKNKWPTANMLNNMWNHYDCYGRQTTYLCSLECKEKHFAEAHKDQQGQQR